MARHRFALLGIILLIAPAACAQKAHGPGIVTCRAMEVFVSKKIGATAVIFHQSAKADGPRLGELLLAHSGAEIEFQTSDGQRHQATVERVKSCFGRGMLLFASKEAKLEAKEDFVVHFAPQKRPHRLRLPGGTRGGRKTKPDYQG